jgi:hypothetical protein
MQGAEFLKTQVAPALGARLLQKITPTDIDDTKAFKMS